MGQSAPWPVNETERLVAVRSILSVGSGPTPELAALSELAKGVFDMARAAIHIVDEDWLRIAHQAGIQVSECSRDISICTRVVLSNDVLVVPDLSAHPELRGFPYVEGGPKFRFYAGAPIELEPGLTVGAFCILDTSPRELKPAEVESLKRFAVLAAALLRLQHANFTMSLAERALRDAAMTDPLTGFYNRKALSALVDSQMYAALQSNETFGALYLDMDGFKAINDTLGHGVGDRVLHEAACRIRDVIRSEDIAVRMGGDEFAVFIPRPAGSHVISKLAERLLEAFRQPFDIDGRLIHAPLSIGGAIAPQAGQDCVSLLQSVDEALYQAKKDGRDRFVSRAI
ncbi:sensor domain-containing diguanylate cyclase [Agrobacterium rosae]|uniref:Cyclic di-GMP phosphodiesterase Gmr n=1 Tax=Agrobacterium rosae TaxID=1972867 RepID=A0A1R3U707_9HYPH|nr:sensor domain-containing diguanylate cyclase [Agrobacterium rosae]SCX35055.1 Cyclic di-GMP phosphodiesterase Gmr [Agrobacterium rosae]